MVVVGAAVVVDAVSVDEQAPAINVRARSQVMRRMVEGYRAPIRDVRITPIQRCSVGLRRTCGNCQRVQWRGWIGGPGAAAAETKRGIWLSDSDPLGVVVAVPRGSLDARLLRSTYVGMAPNGTPLGSRPSQRRRQRALHVPGSINPGCHPRTRQTRCQQHLLAIASVASVFSMIPVRTVHSFMLQMCIALLCVGFFPSL